MNNLNPQISLVIPAYNEEGFIRNVLDSVLQQSFLDFELIVVDNGSTDRTAEIARQYGARVVTELRPGVAQARQAGFLAAAGEIIATTDADTILPADWLFRLENKFRRHPQMVACGGLYKLYSGTKTAKALFPKMAYWLWLADKKIHGGWSLPGSNMAVRKKAFLQAGGFDTNLKIGEDADLSQRLQGLGGVVLDKDLLVCTSGRRYRKGLVVAACTYLPNVTFRRVLNKRPAANFQAVRQEEVSKIALVPPAAALILFSLIWTRGVVLADTVNLEKYGGQKILYGAVTTGGYLKHGSENFSHSLRSYGRRHIRKIHFPDV